MPAVAPATLCGVCGGKLTCAGCLLGDVVNDARRAVAEVVRGAGGRNANARLQASKLVLAKDFLAYLTDEDLLSEVKRRTEAKPARPM